MRVHTIWSRHRKNGNQNALQLVHMHTQKQPYACMLASLHPFLIRIISQNTYKHIFLAGIRTHLGNPVNRSSYIEKICFRCNPFTGYSVQCEQRGILFAIPEWNWMREWDSCSRNTNPLQWYWLKNNKNVLCRQNRNKWTWKMKNEQFSSVCKRRMNWWVWLTTKFTNGLFIFHLCSLYLSVCISFWALSKMLTCTLAICDFEYNRNRMPRKKELKGTECICLPLIQNFAVRNAVSEWEYLSY